MLPGQRRGAQHSHLQVGLLNQAGCCACAFTDGCRPCLGCMVCTDVVAQGALPAVSKLTHEHPGCAAPCRVLHGVSATSPLCIVTIVQDELPESELRALPTWGQLQPAAPALHLSQDIYCVSPVLHWHLCLPAGASRRQEQMLASTLWPTAAAPLWSGGRPGTCAPSGGAS